WTGTGGSGRERRSCMRHTSGLAANFRDSMNASAELLKELRIDRKAPPPPPRKGLWIGVGVAVLLVLLLALGGWWLYGRPAPAEVRTETVVAIGSSTGTAAASVLDATGYVVARRMATVSAKVTGKVREVLI